MLDNAKAVTLDTVTTSKVSKSCSDLTIKWSKSV